ncbi:MAG: TIGR02594 family protein [Rhizobiales bacterium]|nr:TIGR02594 family protein [Hyphomicrobiales bacterium]
MTLSNASRTAVLLCSVAFVAFTVPASARPVHKAAQTFAAVQWQNAGADHDDRYPVVVRQVKGEATQSQSRRRAPQTQAPANSALGGFTSNSLVSEARKYIGTNPTGRGSLWCGAFMDMVLKKTGHAGGGNLASAYARYGTRVSGPQVGAIAVMGRNGGGHVGVVTGVDANGNPIVLSGNTWNRNTGGRHTVAEQVYPRSRVYAYVMP